MHRFCLLILLLSALALLHSCKQKGNDSEAHYLKANDLTLNDDFANAKKEYILSIQSDTANWRACYQLAGVYELEGDFENALYYFSKAVAINPAFTLGYFNRASLEEMVGDDKESMKDIKKTLSAHNNGFFLALLTKARKEYGAGNLKQAITDFDSAINKRQDFYLAYSMRGSCKFKSGDLAGAISDFDNEVRLNPRHSIGYVNRAMAYGQQKNYPAAIADINTALQLDPLWSQGYIYRGMFHYQAHSKDSACGDFRMAYKLKNPQAEDYMKQYCGY